MKRIVFIFILFSLCMILSACSNNAQLNQKLITEGIGIDKINGNTVLTLQCLETDASPDEERYMVKSSEGESVSEAFRQIALKTGRQVILGQTVYMIFNEAEAEDIEGVLNYFAEDYEFSPNAFVFVSECRANQIMSSELLTPDKILQLARGQEATGQIYASKFKEFASSFINKLETPVTSLLNYENDEVTVTGNALLNNGKVDTITPEQTVGLNIINNKISLLSSYVKINNKDISFNLKNCHSSINVENENINITVSAEFYCEYADNDEVKNAAEKMLKEELNNTINTVLQKYKANTFYLDKYMRSQNYDKYKSFTNQSDYCKLNVKTEVKL